MKTRYSQQRGVTMLVVMILLSVMLLGGLAMARMTEIGTLASGNAAFREASMQASEIGINTAFTAVQGLTNENQNTGTWYYASQLATDSNGVPTVDFSTVPEVTVGAYKVRYVVDRVCSGTLPITDPMRQCLVRQVNAGVGSSTNAEQLDPPTARQFRITVQVIGPKDTQAWVQSLVHKG